MMIRTHLSLALVMALGATAAVGCAGSNTSGDDTPPGDDSGDDTPPGDDTTDIPTSPAGKYAVESRFDMTSGLPGTVGDVVNGFIDATDGPDDPGRWLCDTAADQLSGTLGTIAHGACAIAGGYINDQITSIAPELVGALTTIGDQFGQIARKFGLDSQLEITADGLGFLSTHTVNGVNFDVDGQSYAYAFADYGMNAVAVPGVALTYDTTGKLTIGQHDIPVSYGSILRIGLDELIIPALDPLANGLGDMFQDMVDCDAVGEAIYEAIGFGSVGTYSSACSAGLEAGANLVYNKLNDLDAAAVKFTVSGAARATDTNADHKVDEISRGEWTGMIDYAGTQATLSNSTFAGARM